jgi:hypothetical protein
LTGRSSTPRPLDSSLTSLEYWIPACTGMTTESVARSYSSNAGSRSRRMLFARGVHLFYALSNQRAQGKPDARCTRGLVRKLCKRKRTRAYRSSGGNPTFPAQWFYGLSRALPGDQTWDCHRHRQCLNRRLDASLEASGPRAFAVRFTCSRLKHHLRPPHPRPTSVTIANAPLSGTGCETYSLFFYFCKTEIFTQAGWRRRAR